MSEHVSLPQPPIPPPGDGGGRFAPSWRSSGKRASVTLRQEAGGEDAGSMMDPATQSLSDALKITYRFVQFAVLALAVFYILSGFRRVHEGERGIRLLFGKVVAEDLGPGFRFSWPEPFGELVKVQTGPQPLAIDEDFFPQLTEEEKKQFASQGAQALSGGGYGKLNPETDGSLLTGDGNLAHSRWAVTYHREDPKLVEENIDPDFERSIVLAACKRGIVQATASVSIDELLKNTPDESRTADWRPVESVAREIAQKTLDDMDSGLRIDIMSMTARIPPRRVMPSFSEVQSSMSDRQRLIEEAGSERRNAVLAAAGEAAEPLLEQINRYEKALELDDHAEAEAILVRIDRLMQGLPVEIDGKEIKPSVYGRVTNLLSEADRERRTKIANLQGEVQRFEAKLDNYRKNPIVLVHSEWADAYSRIMSRQSMQTMFLPQIAADGRYVLSFNTDPNIAKEIQQRINKQKADEAAAERMRLAEKQRFEQKLESVKEVRND
jgi:regulator of protease activity HflC (stomatin/prohibitin superfamily)